MAKSATFGGLVNCQRDFRREPNARRPGIVIASGRCYDPPPAQTNDPRFTQTAYRSTVRDKGGSAPVRDEGGSPPARHETGSAPVRDEDGAALDERGGGVARGANGSRIC